MARPDGIPVVWQVEQRGESETYSNGLRIDNRFAVSARPRSYLAFRAGQPDDGTGIRRSDPAGIVFHATESQMAPFEAQQNRALQRIGESLLEYVRRRRAYNFLIDRFGRVYRVVVETDAANHAGHSVWSDEKWLYINLNDSFLAVSLETQTAEGQPEAALNPGQIRAAAMLAEMLRWRYHIAAGNCVTHAQVSVNPANMQVGYHTDWASSFPFEQLGLPDNYAKSLPALSVFGFEYDSNFLRSAEGRMYTGIELAMEELRDRAARAGRTPDEYRRGLQKRYRDKVALLDRLKSQAEKLHREEAFTFE